MANTLARRQFFLLVICGSFLISAVAIGGSLLIQEQENTHIKTDESVQQSLTD